MANDYMDSWELNGDTVLIQDFGKGKNGGVGVLDENGKIPLANVPAIYTSNLITSKEDKRKMTLKEWTDRAVPFLNSYGTIWNDYEGEYTVINYYADLDIRIALKRFDHTRTYISVKNAPYVSFYNARSIDYCIGDIIGYNGNAYCHISDLILHYRNYTYISTPSGSYSSYGSWILNGVLYSLGRKTMGESLYYVSLMTSTNGIDFVEIYEHETVSLPPYALQNQFSAAYSNGIYVFMNSYFILTINNGLFYYTEEQTFNKYANVLFFNNVFTDGHKWSSDGINWNNATYPEGAPDSSYSPVLGVLRNKIVIVDQHTGSTYWYTEDGKTVRKYVYDLYVGEHTSSNKIVSLNFSWVGIYADEHAEHYYNEADNGFLFCFATTADSNAVIMRTSDAINFTVAVDHYVPYFVHDKGKAFLTEGTYSGGTWSFVGLKQSPDPDLWLPYSTFKNYIKGGN